MQSKVIKYQESEEFQFQHGAIERETCIRAIIRITAFQFQYGAIERIEGNILLDSIW